MATTSEYLTQLQKDLADLKAKYKEKGLDISNNATFTDLVSEFDNLPSGGDLDEYFVTNVTSDPDTTYGYPLIKKLPEITIDDSVRSMNNLFNSNVYSGDIKVRGGKNVMYPNFQNIRNVTKINLTDFTPKEVKGLMYVFDGNYKVEEIIGISNWDISLVPAANYCFGSCSKLKTLNLSGWKSINITNTANMFSHCLSLVYLDIRNFVFDNVNTYVSMFGSSESNGVPADCEIIVKSDTEKTWITEKFTWLTNIKTVAEYEAENS